MKRDFLVFSVACAIAIASLSPVYGAEADAKRQNEVSERGADVMPFALKATTHVFTKTDDGGIQRVVAKDPSDVQQIRLVRDHLQSIRAQFAKRDFSSPAKIHGDDMPGLAELRAAKPGDLAIAYKPLQDGAELIYKARNPKLVPALHAWFDAQLSDHGSDAMEGHHHHMH